LPADKTGHTTAAEEARDVRRILIADDEHNIRHILDFSLHVEGFDVLAAQDGEEALALAASELPDLVIMDVMMPGCGGIEACRRLKQNPRTRQIPVILLTARSSREDREAGEAAGAVEYITKPFSPQKVIDLIQSILGVAHE
jgi:CheY-like chemotaxis protein